MGELAWERIQPTSSKLSYMYWGITKIYTMIINKYYEYSFKYFIFPLYTVLKIYLPFIPCRHFVFLTSADGAREHRTSQELHWKMWSSSRTLHLSMDVFNSIKQLYVYLFMDVLHTTYFTVGIS